MSDSLITFDPAGCFLPQYGLRPDDLIDVAPRLEAARRIVLEEDPRQYAHPETIATDKQPLDAAFFPLPEELLAAYRALGGASEVGQILEASRQLSELVDRVVVLGIGGSYMGARALMDACCQPYFNELDRGRRGGHPRMYFEGNNVDNDATQGLLQLLASERSAPGGRGPWGLVVISKSGGTLETAVAFRQFLSELRAACGDRAELLKKLVVPVTGDSGKLRSLAARLGCEAVFRVPDGVGGRFSVLSAVGLLPAALLGLDIVRLLEGAAAMNDHFRSAPVGRNAVLDYVGIGHLMEAQRGASIRVLSVWSKGLEAAGLWYDQLLAESLGKAEQGATPITAVNTRDLHSRAQQHQEGRRDKLHTNLIVDSWRFDPLPVGASDRNEDDLNRYAQRTLPELMTAAIQGTNQAYREGGRPTANLHLPRVDEYHLGQFFQMMMLATVVEGRLININPYGQPGVEAYKRNMQRELAAR